MKINVQTVICVKTYVIVEIVYQKSTFKDFYGY